MDRSTVSTSTSTQITWRFLIKALISENLVLYMTRKIKDLVIFSDENKGLKSIAKIRCSVIKSFIADSMASIRLVTYNVEVVFEHAPQAFVWLLNLYGGSFGSYLSIPLENELFKISQT